MKINTKFNINQEVFKLNEGLIVKYKITGISIDIIENTIVILYEVMDEAKKRAQKHIREDYLFEDVNELVENLKLKSGFKNDI